MIDCLMKIWHRLLFEIMEISRTALIRCNYAMDLRRIRHKRGPINVLFLVCETSKWKAQSLYDLMAASKDYRPKIGIVLAGVDASRSPEKLKAEVERRMEYFRSRNMEVELTYDLVYRQPLELRKYHPDVVFYSLPFGLPEQHAPQHVSYFALTGYVPYYVQFRLVPEYDCTLPFHHDVWCQIAQSQYFANAFVRYRNCLKYAGRVVGLGHTALDPMFLAADVRPHATKTVIYAPHWSIDHPKNENIGNFSTFLWSGKPILEYAKAHREYKWIYKPHPSLRMALHNTGAMADDETEEYWREWNRVGEVCETGDYQQLFLASSAMITDCSSFLSEYGATGRPLIRLISATAKLATTEDSPCKALDDAFYQVHDLEELKDTLARVVEQGDDYKREERLAALEKSGLRSTYAAKNIMEYFNRTFRRGVSETQK